MLRQLVPLDDKYLSHSAQPQKSCGLKRAPRSQHHSAGDIMPISRAVGNHQTRTRNRHGRVAFSTPMLLAQYRHRDGCKGTRSVDPATPATLLQMLRWGRERLIGDSVPRCPCASVDSFKPHSCVQPHFIEFPCSMRKQSSKLNTFGVHRMSSDYGTRIE